MTRSRRILPPRRFWTEADDELLRRQYAGTPTAELARVLKRSRQAVYEHARKLGLSRDPESISALVRTRVLDPAHGGRATRFPKGHRPANKGRKMPPGWTPGKMASTQFREGHRPHTWRPVGTLSVNSDGILDEKVNDDPGPRHVRWKPVHRLVWLKDGSVSLEQAKAISELSQVIVNTAKVEVDYLRTTNGGESTFISGAIGASNLPPGILGVRRHRLEG